MFTLTLLIASEAQAGRLTVGTTGFMSGVFHAINQCSHQRVNLVSDTRGYEDWPEHEPTLSIWVPSTTSSWTQTVGLVNNLVEMLDRELGKHGLPERTARAGIAGEGKAILLRVEASPSSLFPDRCTYHNPGPGPELVTLGAIWKHCQDTTSPDEAGERGELTPPSDLYGGWLHIQDGETVTLTTYLQRMSDKYDLLWRYQCYDGRDLMGPGPLCMFSMGAPKYARKSGEGFLEASRTHSGATGCVDSAP